MSGPGNHEALIGQIIGGRYEVVRLIAEGGMGYVYEVRNVRLGRSFAMKTLTSRTLAKAHMLQRFRREADVIAAIKHPNIVDIVDWETLDDGSPAIVMEYLRGEDLKPRITDNAMAWPQLARIADQLLAALSIAHANGVVHRDLKPGNVFLAVDDEGQERVKLLDFGVSKVRDAASPLTSDSQVFGTPSYMSPEQVDGHQDDIGPHSDVWSIGALLHEMATGKVAFGGERTSQILNAVCHKSPPSLLDLRADAPPAFVELVAAALERDITKRIPDASALRARLREALRDVDGVRFDEIPAAANVVMHVTNPSTIDMPSPSVAARRRLAPVALVVGGIAAALVVVAIVAGSRGKSGATSHAPVPIAKHTANSLDESLEPPDGAVAAPVASPAAPAAPEIKAAPALASDPPAPKPRAKHQTPAPAAQPSTTTQPAAQPVVPAKKKQCAKDDVECLYGDGT